MTSDLTSGAYAELHCHSYFSLLDASSSPEVLAARAKQLGLRALAITDHNSMAGAVRFWVAAREAGLHAVFGAEVTIGAEGMAEDDYSHLTLLAETQRGYANVCRLLTRAHLRGTPLATLPGSGDADEPAPDWLGKLPPYATWDEVYENRGGLLALSGCSRGETARALLQRKPDQARAAAQHLLDVFGRGQVWMELQQHYLPESDRLLRQQVELAAALKLPCVATNNVHMATREDARLRDAMIAIRHNETLTEARTAGRLPINANAALAAPAEMVRRFARAPEAVRASVDIAERCTAAPDFGTHRLPAFKVPDGRGEFEYLYALCHANLPQRYPHLSSAVLKQLAHELDVIERAGLAGYFLIVWDIVRFSRQQGIRCQGRGSAANSIVSYLLGITSIDPLQHNLLFERFLSPDRHTTPDIDIDFAADRREEVIQYVYAIYGREHTAMVCNLVTYKARSAIRDLGKALAYPTATLDGLVRALETNTPSRAADQLEAMACQEYLASGQGSVPRVLGGGAGEKGGTGEREQGAGEMEHPLRVLADLVRRIGDAPRHLSIHTGGMLITAPPLDEVVPLERASMPGRVVCQWNKDSVEDAGLIKIDLLGLRTLGLITEALEQIDNPPDLDMLPLDDPAIYEMLQQADTIGTFQVESRAQMQMLPRLAPRIFEDIIVEVAIVRPGPIQGGTVHPYLRRRAGLEPVTYAHDCLEPVLKETLGVLLFQEQAIRMAVVAAAFKPGEADLLRRALSRFGGGELPPMLRALGNRFLEGATKNGLDVESAENAFKQLAGFAGYGLCKSHAASFALIAYQTCWLKLYHPAAFYSALLNQQPMGFYRPEVIVGDMRRHGVDLFPPDVNRSEYKYRVEGNGLRQGLCGMHGLGKEGWERIQAAREAGAFSTLQDMCVRTRLPRDVVSDMIRAGALDALGERRALLWELGELVYQDDELEFVMPITEVTLPALSDMEQMAWEYELLGLSPDGQVVQHYRAMLNALGVFPTAVAKQQRNGRRVRVAGMAVVRQRPPTAKGILFLSLEDETGLLDIVVKPHVYEPYKRILREEPLLLFDGVIQLGSGAVSLLASRVERMPAM